jgi:hypothetical protein
METGPKLRQWVERMHKVIRTEVMTARSEKWEHLHGGKLLNSVHQSFLRNYYSLS